MKDRLTTDKTKIFARENPTLMSMTKSELRNHYNEIFDRLQEYEVAEEQGQLIRPPCKVGDKVYVVDYTRLGNMIFECEVEEISQFSYGTYYYLNWGVHIPRFKACQIDSFGKSVFLTREEAEAKLKEGGEE